LCGGAALGRAGGSRSANDGPANSPPRRRPRVADATKRGFGRSPGCLDVPRGGDRRAGGHHQMPAVSAAHAGSTSAQIRPCRERWRSCGLRSVVEPELGLRRVRRRRERRRRARQPERREHRARQGGVHHHGDHAATATARARQHVGGDYVARCGSSGSARAPSCCRSPARRGETIDRIERTRRDERAGTDAQLNADASQPPRASSGRDCGARDRATAGS
jgi:hypothetical protein